MSIDYKDFTPKSDQDITQGKKNLPKQGANSVQWWLADKDQLPFTIGEQVKTLIQADKGRIDRLNNEAKLYGNYSPVSFVGYTITKVNSNFSPTRDRISCNVIGQCVDTLASKFIKNKPKPMFLTHNGDYKLQRKAKKLDDFCFGVFQQQEVYKLAQRTLKDALVWGDGIIHVYAENNEIKFERVMPYEILVDYLESHYGSESTKTIHRIKNIDRSQLISLFPEHKDALININNLSDVMTGTVKSVSDQICVIESWRLPSTKDSGDGVHCITIPNGLTLFVEEYDKDFFPFAFLNYNQRQFGFWSQSLTEMLTPIQVELNRCLMSVQRSYHLGGTFKIMLKTGSKVVKSHLDNSIGAIIEYAGDTPPQYITPPIVQPEIYQHISTLKAMAFETAGISQLSANSTKPAGLNSGKALREFNDIETDRFQMFGQSWANLFMDLAKITVSTARDIYENDGDSVVTLPGKKFIKTIKWSEVSMEDDQFSMQLFPVSMLPSTPEGKLAAIQEMITSQMISQDVGKRLLDFPDLDQEENLANASLDFIYETMDKIIEDGIYTPPDSYEPDLNVNKKIALEYLMMGKRDNVEEEKLMLVRQYIDQCNAIQQDAQATAMQQVAMQQAAAPGIQPAPVIPPAPIAGVNSAV